MSLKTVAASLALAGAALVTNSNAELAPEQGRIITLPAKPNPHWVLVNDIVFNHMEAGKAFLVDGDSGTMVGMMSTGFQWLSMVIPQDWSALYAPQTYLSRGTRGKRTDIISIYDPTTLSVTGEIEIPAKRMEGLPVLWNSALSDDEQFLMVYNFTPAQSVSVVDMKARQFVGEIETPGCAFVYPAGKRSWNMLCGDASMLTVHIDDKGALKGKKRTKPFFDIEKNFVTEKAVRHGDTWLYVTNQSDIVPVDVSGEQPAFLERWSLTTAAEKAEGWRIGGVQHMAVHHASERLYTLMHRGGKDSHKDPGEEVWVFDLRTGWKIARIPLQGLATAIQVTQDNQPLLFTLFIAEPALQVYDAVDGRFLRTVDELGFSPTVLQTPAVPATP